MRCFLLYIPQWSRHSFIPYRDLPQNLSYSIEAKFCLIISLNIEHIQKCFNWNKSRRSNEVMQSRGFVFVTDFNAVSTNRHCVLDRSAVMCTNLLLSILVFCSKQILAKLYFSIHPLRQLLCRCYAPSNEVAKVQANLRVQSLRFLSVLRKTLRRCSRDSGRNSNHALA
jgi:hypothetical protein